MNTKENKVENLEILREIFGNKYDDFIKAVSKRQKLIAQIDTSPIDNYISAMIKDKDMDLLRYVYQNVRYYFLRNTMYTKKLEEGMAVFISKAAVANHDNPANLRNYLSRGDYSTVHDISNPFEEIVRLILGALRKDSYLSPNPDIQFASLAKIKYDDDSIIEVLNLAITRDGISSKISQYGYGEQYGIMIADLEMSNITSDDVNSATTKENSEVLSQQFEQLTDFYHTRIEYERMLNGFLSETTCEKLETRFANKILCAKRNIGMYEQTKQLVKKGQ